MNMDRNLKRKHLRSTPTLCALRLRTAGAMKATHANAYAKAEHARSLTHSHSLGHL